MNRRFTRRVAKAVLSVPQQNSCPRAGSPGTFLPLPPCNYQSGNHCFPLSRLDASLGPILFESYVDKEALGQELWWLAMKSVLSLIPLLLNVSIQITRSMFVPTCSYPSSQRFGSSLWMSASQMKTPLYWIPTHFPMCSCSSSDLRNFNGWPSEPLSVSYLF